MPKTIFLNTQLALFFGRQIDRPDILLTDFNKVMGDVFDQPPLTFPLPNSPELANTPIVQYTSSNNLHLCSFARNRADYHHYSSDKIKHYTFEEIKGDFIDNAQKFIDFFSKLAPVNRVGFVIQFFIEDNDAHKTIAHLLKDDFRQIFGGDIREGKLEYISRKKFVGDQFEINDRIVMNKVETIFYDNKKEEKKTGVLIMRDFNTIPEKKSEYQGKFNRDMVKQIIEETEGYFQLKEIANLLWPTKL